MMKVGDRVMVRGQILGFDLGKRKVIVGFGDAKNYVPEGDVFADTSSIRKLVTVGDNVTVSDTDIVGVVRYIEGAFATVSYENEVAGQKMKVVDTFQYRDLIRV